ncbi:DNA repair protein RadB [Methanomicrobium sp. W14]|uniref:DNA repair and recombination protein RadB n=1 Tax=Methanomicrobium sp. W14 TaxID=2817839 RepID=UPI001AEB63AA|nr:DNA repair and recombination protein RadB [Methanomicrobium sp. W14]MBP2132908.1 DNA repair protein RadB [Methanomicrobium sp. W14]
MTDSSKIETGCRAFDELIGGGLERKVITQIYGEPAAGKSTITMMSITNVLKDGKYVIAIDSEGFSIERFRQVCGDDAVKLAEKLFIFEPLDFTEQGLMISECDPLLRENDVGLIVLDSATALYRTELGSNGEGQKKLGRQVIRLLGYAKRYSIPVIITNQVYMDIKNEKLSGLGGTSLRHISKIIIRLEKDLGYRKAVLEKHRSMEEGGCIRFKIVNDGIIQI